MDIKSEQQIDALPWIAEGYHKDLYFVGTSFSGSSRKHVQFL